MIHKQSVFEPWPIESESVQAICTSPPYFALRKYSIPDIIIGGDKDCKHEFETIERKPAGGSGKNSPIGGHQDDFSSLRDGSYFSNICIHCNAWKGQYGLETTPYGNEHSYVEHTRLWAKEAWRVLRNDGIFFLNLADSYSGSGGPGSPFDNKYKKYVYDFDKYKNPNRDVVDYPKKCQLLIPHRVAIALVEDGWTLRNTIVWYKTNGMPESVTDRFSKKYEYIFMFTKQEKYYFDLDAVKEPTISKDFIIRDRDVSRLNNTPGRSRMGGLKENNYDFKNPGDVWAIPTAPSTEKHFAMWPERLVERMVKCSTKAGDIVLDCFAGSCTTGIVAESLHRKFIGIELGYENISKRRMSKIQKEMFV